MNHIRLALRLASTVVRVSILAVLALCEPLISFTLGVLALLAMVSAGVWALEKPLSSSPVLGLLAFAFAVASLRVLYRLLLRAMA